MDNYDKSKIITPATVDNMLVMSVLPKRVVNIFGTIWCIFGFLLFVIMWRAGVLTVFYNAIVVGIFGKLIDLAVIFFWLTVWGFTGYCHDPAGCAPSF